MGQQPLFDNPLPILGRRVCEIDVFQNFVQEYARPRTGFKTGHFADVLGRCLAYRKTDALRIGVFFLQTLFSKFDGISAFTDEG